MKKIAIALVLSLGITSTAYAHGYRYGYGHRYAPQPMHHHYHHRGNHWVAPALGGIIIGAAIANANAYQSAPVYVAPPVAQPEYYQCLVQVFDPNTNSYRNEVRTCVR